MISQSTCPADDLDEMLAEGRKLLAADRAAETAARAAAKSDPRTDEDLLAAAREEAQRVRTARALAECTDYRYTQVSNGLAVQAKSGSCYILPFTGGCGCIDHERSCQLGTACKHQEAARLQSVWALMEMGWRPVNARLPRP